MCECVGVCGWSMCCLRFACNFMRIIIANRHINSYRHSLHMQMDTHRGTHTHTHTHITHTHTHTHVTHTHTHTVINTVCVYTLQWGELLSFKDSVWSHFYAFQEGLTGFLCSLSYSIQADTVLGNTLHEY